MANKSKRARSDISSVPEVNKDDVITRLRSELDVERKISKQLRREKAFEVQQTRELERNEASISLKDLATKLHQEKQRELEAQREALKCRFETDTVKVTKQKDQEIKKLKKDLAKCQNELREEVTKRGLSTSARGTFELERTKLLQEIKELGVSRKRLEDALHSASEMAKQKNQEMRQLQETCKQEVAAVEKSANAEIRKLLEEMKAKDHLLALMDRNQYPDKSNSIKQQLANQSIQELVCASKEIDSWEQKIPKKGEGTELSSASSFFPNISLQKKVYELEKQLRQASGVNHAILEKNQEVITCNKTLEETIEKLQNQNKQLNADLEVVKYEASHLNELLSTNKIDLIASEFQNLKRKAKEQEQIIFNLRLECEENSQQNKLVSNCQKIKKPKCQKKGVTFLLPGELHPVKGGLDEEDFKLYGHDDNEDDDSHDDSLSTDSELSLELTSMELSTDMMVMEDEDDTAEQILSESEMKDYNLLMKEHMELEHSYASMVQSQPDQDWHIERESLNLAILTLEKKIHELEESEEQMKMKCQEVCEQNEELEFQILEFEDSSGTMNSAHEIADLALMEKNKKLELELEVLRKQLVFSVSEDTERDVAVQCLITPLTKDEIEGTSDFDWSESDDAIMMSSISTTTSGFDEPSLEMDSMVDVPDYMVDKIEIDGNNEEEDMLTPTPSEEDSEQKNLKTKEEHWVRLVENLEMRLRCSRERERQMSDKIALMNEEKNRRIRALQEQIDALEGSEVRLLDPKVEVNEEITEKCKKQVIESDAEEERGSATLKLELNLEWSERSEDVLSGTPSSIDGSYFPQQPKRQEAEEDALLTQISYLEKDCELLREIVDMDEGIIQDLQVKVEDLKQSEQNLHQIVERLEAAESRLRSNASEMEEHIHELEADAKKFHTLEGWSRAQLEKFQASESGLSKKLEETMEDLQSMEQKLKKKISELDQEKRTLTEKNEKLEDHVGELEAVAELLRQKIRNVQNSEGDLQRRLSEMESEMIANAGRDADAEQQKEGLTHRVQILENEKVNLIEELDELKHTGDARCCEIDQLNKRISALKETLSSSNRIVSLLRTQLEDTTCREVALRNETQECRANEQVLLENITMLEGSVMLLTEKLKQAAAKENLIKTDGQTQTETAECTERGSDLDCCLLQVPTGSDTISLTSFISVPSTDSIFEDVSSCADDARSIDEASEISDEDDGALLPVEKLAADSNSLKKSFQDVTGETILHQYKMFQPSVTGSVESIHDSSLESIHDSGMYSMQQQISRNKRNTRKDQCTQTVYAPPIQGFRQFAARPVNSSTVCAKELKPSISLAAIEEKTDRSGKYSHIPLSTRYLGGTRNKTFFSKPPVQKKTYIAVSQTVSYKAKNTKHSQDGDLNNRTILLDNDVQRVNEVHTYPKMMDSIDSLSVKCCLLNNQSMVIINDQSDASQERVTMLVML